jgi:hypothetical protein
MAKSVSTFPITLGNNIIQIPGADMSLTQQIMISNQSPYFLTMDLGDGNIHPVDHWTTDLFDAGSIRSQIQINAVNIQGTAGLLPSSSVVITTTQKGDPLIKGAYPVTSTLNTVSGISTIPALIQSAKAISATGFTPSITFTASQAGSCLIAHVFSGALANQLGSLAPTCTTPGWVLVQNTTPPGTATPGGSLFAYPNNPGGLTTVSFALHGLSLSGVSEILMCEFSGLSSAPVDVSMGNVANVATTNWTTLTGPPTGQSEELIIAVFFDNSNITNAGGFTVGTGYTMLQTGNQSCMEYQIVTAAAAYSATVTTGNSHIYTGVFDTFKASLNGGGSATQTSVNSSATTVTLLSPNLSRTAFSVYNDSTAVLYLSMAGSASTTAYTVQLPPKGFYESPTLYSGSVSGIWASVNGAARICEYI